MAGALVSFVIENLWDLLSHEKFHGVYDQVSELQTDLNTLKSFLKDESATVENFLDVIQEIVFDAEDIVETFIRKDEPKKKDDIMKHIRRFACILPERWEIASEIGSLHKCILKVIREMQSFGVQQIIANVRDPQPLQERLEFARKYESNLVGLEANVEKLVGYLVEEDNVQVVCMTGMGGLGKTTLARQAFNHYKVKEKFDRLVWVCVTQDCNPINVWQSILRTLSPKEEEKKISEMRDAIVLQDELFRLLETIKSLIVFDDIWKEEDWDLIKPIFPHKKGSKVLLTSRTERVAGCGKTYVNFKPEYLSDQDSWTLFQKIVMPSKNTSELTDIDEEMEELGKQMIKHCKGLPLAVRVLGELLAEKYTVHDWKRLSENIGSHLVGRTNDDNNNSLNRVLSLSYEELPGYLKYCFLYLAHFPEDYEINVEHLSYYWAAEGIFRYNNGESIRDVGHIYIEELVKRNMVISERDNTTLRFETCRLHNLMRDICLSKAKEENILHIIGIPSPTADSQFLSTSRRIISQYPNTLDVEREISNPKVRSLVVVAKDKRNWDLSSIFFTRLQMLRVLHLRGASFNDERVLDSIGKLIHLRYLNLEDAKVSHLPFSLRNLKLLIYLNLNIDLNWKCSIHMPNFLTRMKCSVHMPNVLMEMKELRYLALPGLMDKETKLKLSHQVNLETIVNFSVENCSLEDLGSMTRLRTLGICITGDSNLETLSASIGGLKHLENLDISYDGAKGTKEWITLLDFSNLKQLELKIIIPLLSDDLKFTSRITTLSLRYCHLKEDPMPILEKLLHLKELTFDYESFSGKRMVCSRGGFPQLQKLVLWGLEEMEEWIVEEGSMPLLHTLVIIYCRKLKEIPDGLRFITFLKYLRVGYMGEEWKERLSEGEEDYYKVQHIPYVIFE